MTALKTTANKWDEKRLLKPTPKQLGQLREVNLLFDKQIDNERKRRRIQRIPNYIIY